MDRAIELPRPADDSDVDQVVVLRNVPWTQYEALLRARGKSRRPRMAYLDGALEIMTTSGAHELAKILLGRLVEAYAEAREVQLNGMGQPTFRKQLKKAGLEPDESYCVGKLRAFPTLAIEIVHKSGGIQKLEAYRRLGIAEVWFFIDGRIWIYRLSGKNYVHEETSTELRGIDPSELEHIIRHANYDEQRKIVRTYRESLLPSSRR